MSVPERWLTQDEQKLWRSYLGAHFRLFQYLNDDVEEHSGFDSLTYEILERLSESDNWSMRMSDLAQSVSAAKSRLTYRITQLEEEGVVERAEVPEDGRGQLCVLTDKGYKKLEDAAPHHVQAVLTKFINAVDPADISKLTDMFECIAPEVRVKGCSEK